MGFACCLFCPRQHLWDHTTESSLWLERDAGRRQGGEGIQRRGSAIALPDDFMDAPKRRQRLEFIAVFCLFAVMVCVSTWPLLTGLSALVPPHWDPRLNSWNMASNCRRILSNPLLLFHGNNFYPYGTTKAFTEVLLVPSLFSMPVFLLSGNPILSYNVTLLLLWSVSGLTMYLCVKEMVGNRWGALLGATVWTLCPFRTDYYLEFQMQMCFAVPLIILYSYRFFRTQSVKHAALACLFLGIQAMSSWSWMLLVSFYLVVFSLSYLLLKWRGWKIGRLLKVVPVLVIFSVVMYPLTSPYFRVRKELRIERRLGEAVDHSADVLTYVETGPTRMYHFSPTHSHAETSLFPGFIALLFTALSSAYFVKREREAVRSRTRRVVTPILMGGLVFSLFQLVLRALTVTEAFRSVHAMHFATASTWAVGFSLLLLVLRGYSGSRSQAPERAFCERDLLTAFLFAGFVMFLLSLGPVVQVKRRELDHGIYYHLYGIVFFLHAVRVATRFGGLAMFSIAMLSALGVKWLHSLVGRRWKLIGGLMFVPPVLAFLEYCPWRLEYERFLWEKPPAVYDPIVSDREDFAIAEWPLGSRYDDGEFLVWSLVHRKRVFEGVSRWRGTMPPRTRELSRTLSELTNLERAAESVKELRAVYPTKYLVVHGRYLPRRNRKAWESLTKDPPEGLKLLGVYDKHDYLFAVSPVVEGGAEFSREFSFEYALRHSVARFRLRNASHKGDTIGNSVPQGCPVKIYFNETLLRDDTLTADWKKYRFRLTKPYHKVAPNCIRIVASGSDAQSGEMEFADFSLRNE